MPKSQKPRKPMKAQPVSALPTNPEQPESQQEALPEGRPIDGDKMLARMRAQIGELSQALAMAQTQVEQRDETIMVLEQSLAEVNRRVAELEAGK